MIFSPPEIQGRTAPATSWASIGVNHLGWVEPPQVREKPGPKRKPRQAPVRQRGIRPGSRTHSLWLAMLRAKRPLTAGEMAKLLDIATNDALFAARNLMRHGLVTREGQRCHYRYTAKETAP